jgi:pyruvyltransferase
MKVFWSRCGAGEGNFGDRLTPFLLEHFGVPCDWSPPEHADLIGVGSVLERVPEAFKGVIWTSGFMRAESRKLFSHARVAAVRGCLTRQRLEGISPKDVCVGDGGLLSHLLVQPAKKRHPLGLVPHFVDAGDPIVAAIQSSCNGITVIDVCQSPLKVIQAIAKCEAILSSSLHGLVVADSLGIPNHWMELNHGTEVVMGAGFKFHDYYSIFGLGNARPFCPASTDNLETILPLFEGYARSGLANIQQSLLNSLADIVAAQRSISPEERAREQEKKQAWMARLKPVLRELAEVMPPEAKFILVDEDQLRFQIALDRVLPFLEKEGAYWGPPADDETAISELERMRTAHRVSFIVFAWPAFWWLEHYRKFAKHLRANFRCTLQNERLVVFDLRSAVKAGSAAESF